MISVQTFSDRAPSEPSGTIGVCARDHMNIRTVESLLLLRLPEGSVDRQINVGSVLTYQRNLIVQRMRGDWVLFIDDDMVFPPDALLRLLDTYWHLKDMGARPWIVGGLCHRRTPPHMPTMYMRHRDGSGPFAAVEDYFGRGIVEVDATGMAFALVHKDAFEAIAGEPMPPFEERIKVRRPAEFFRWIGGMGEDLRFCLDVKEKGGQVFVDTAIKIGHVYETVVDDKTWLRDLAGRSEQAADEQQAILDHYGLRAVRPSEARELLG